MISGINLKRNESENSKEEISGKKKMIIKKMKSHQKKNLSEDSFASFQFAEQVQDPSILPYLKGSRVTSKRVEL